MTIGKTIALTRQNFVGRVMSLLFNMLSSITDSMDVSLGELRELVMDRCCDSWGRKESDTTEAT